MPSFELVTLEWLWVSFVEVLLPSVVQISHHPNSGRFWSKLHYGYVSMFLKCNGCIYFQIYIVTIVKVLSVNYIYIYIFTLYDIYVH